jgi:hypothetical protein
MLMTWILLAASLADAQTTFTRTYNFPETINLSCCSSFSYGFTSVDSDATLDSLGMIQVTSIAVSAVGSINSPDLLGDAGLDWEVFVGPQPFGLPTGEISGTSVNPGTYSSSAPTQLRFAEIIPLSSGTYKFAGVFTFDDSTLTTDTPINNLHYYANGPMHVSGGLYVQAFLWSGALGANIDFSSISITITGTTTSTAQPPLQFVPITPCRVADTRNAPGPLGGPLLSSGEPRSFPITQGACGIPSTAQAYSLNVTAVPTGPLGYLTLWPTGTPMPTVSLLNSLDGRVKENASIVPAGTSGQISVYASAYNNAPTLTNVILDINGYFVPPNGTTLAFYPVTPCRAVDTRNAAGPLGGPYLAAGQTRSFPLLSSTTCNLPASAEAYSLNVTAVPAGSLGYLTVWPTGQPQPTSSTLNATTGTVTASAAIVPAGSSGAVSVFVQDDSDVVLDVNGYFAPPGVGGTSLYTTTPCRVFDSRNFPFSPFPGTFIIAPAQSYCTLSNAVAAYVFNVTVVPLQRVLNVLELWPTTSTQPLVSTLNSFDGAITSNMAIVPTNDNDFNAYASQDTQLLIDVSSYFAP